MALISGGLSTLPDAIIGTLLLLFAGLSLLFNPFILCHNWKTSKNPSRFLFKLLSVLDLITAITCSIVFGYLVLLTETIPTSVMEDSQLDNKPATSTQLLHGIIVVLMVYIPCYVTPTATFIKFCGIRYPLRTITILKVQKILVFMLITPTFLIFYFTIAGIDSLFWSWGLKFTTVLRVGNLNILHMTIILSALPILVQILAMLSSAYIIRYLINSCANRRKERMRVAAKKMILINFGSMVFLMVNLILPLFSHYFLSTDFQENYNILTYTFPIFMCLAFFPCMLSAFNPFVYIFFSPHIVTSRLCCWLKDSPTSLTGS